MTIGYNCATSPPRPTKIYDHLVLIILANVGNSWDISAANISRAETDSNDKIFYFRTWIPLERREQLLLQ